MFANCILALIIILAAPSSIAAAEYYGTFDGDPDGVFIPHPERPLFRLNKDLTYTDINGLAWTAPAGETVDGASIPQFAWSIIGGPFSGNYLRAAIVHDYFCCSKSRDYGDTHKAFWRGLRLDGIGAVKAYTMWAAVRAFGPAYWSVDPTLPAPTPCKGGDSVLIGANPQTSGIAASKIVSIARTLETTGGVVLDVVGSKLVFAGTKEADVHLDKLRAAVQKNFDAQRKELGLFSPITESDQIQQTGLETRGFLIWDLDTVPELAPYVPDEVRSRYEAYRADKVALAVPAEEIYGEAFWMPTFQKLQGSGTLDSP